MPPVLSTPLWARVLIQSQRFEMEAAVTEDEARSAALGVKNVTSHSVSRRHDNVLFNTTKWMRVTITKIVRCGQVVVDMGRCTTTGCEGFLAPVASSEDVVRLLSASPVFNASVGTWWRAVTSIGEMHSLDHIRRRQYAWFVSRLIDCLLKFSIRSSRYTNAATSL